MVLNFKKDSNYYHTNSKIECTFELIILTLFKQIRRLSDEDISKTDVTSNAVNNLKSQTANGLNQNIEKKLDGPNNALSTNESMDNEVNYSLKTKTLY